SLRDSVRTLGKSGLLNVEECCRTLLTPAHTDEFPLCKSTHSRRKCYPVMARVLHAYQQLDGEGIFVGGKARFVISDDMTVKPASTRTMQSLPQALGCDGIGHGFEVVKQVVERKQLLAMLEAFLSSDTVLTDAFLPKESIDSAARATMKPSINRNIPPSDQDSAGSSPESKIKIFYDTCEKKVMYAECNHEFVNLLLGFLTYPVGSVIKNTGPGTSHLEGASIIFTEASSISTTLAA
ncbi:hypothetical protein CFC21_069000, partial [Triticum aestivum]